MDSIDSIEVQVKCMRHEADGVLSVELAPYARDILPAPTAGSHIDLHLPNGLIRSYSLMNTASDRYFIGVYNDPNGRGGSKYVHEQLRAGQLLRISSPRNNFPLVEDAGHSIFIAGGIGITPFIAMMERLNAAERNWTLHYCSTTPERAAFKEIVQDLAMGGFGTVNFNFDGLPGATMLDIGAVLNEASASTHFYCCGPAGMLKAYRDAASGVPADRVHFEYFNADTDAATGGGFDVVLAKSGTRLNVPEGNTILDVLQAHGVAVPYSCQQGVCGACELNVLAGTPDHRDMILSDEEREAGRTMMICCSGSLSPELVLDI